MTPGWSKRERSELSDPIDEEDPYPAAEQMADGEFSVEEILEERE